MISALSAAKADLAISADKGDTGKENSAIYSHCSVLVILRMAITQYIPWMSSVVLRPVISWAGAAPSAEDLAALHHAAHEQCYIANSVKTDIRVEIYASLAWALQSTALAAQKTKRSVYCISRPRLVVA